jgi:hypothetical protein
MIRVTISAFLLAALAGCYSATPFATRTSADKASQAEIKQRWADLNESMDAWRAARREEAREVRQKDAALAKKQ